MARVVLTGGGTGGHLYPGLAIIEAMREIEPCEVLFIGTKHGLESRVVPENGLPFRTVWIGGMHRGKIKRNLLFPLKMLVSFIQAAFILHGFKPELVIGTGGYVSWPVLSASSRLRIPYVIQEQNQAPGLVTRLMDKRAERIFLSFENSKQFYKNQNGLRITGNPTRSMLSKGNREEAYKLFYLNPNKKTLFVFGGSQGAYGLNQEMLRIYPALLEDSQLQILWSTGPRWFDAIQTACSLQSDRIKVVPYITDMGAAYRITDLLVCRSGATTIAEVTRVGLPVIFVPFPAAADNHQETNARALVEENAAELVLESEFKNDRLPQAIKTLFADDQKRQSLSVHCKKLGKPEAAQDIAREILSLCHAEKRNHG